MPGFGGRWRSCGYYAAADTGLTGMRPVSGGSYSPEVLEVSEEQWMLLYFEVC